MRVGASGKAGKYGHVVTKVEMLNWKPDPEAMRALKTSVEDAVENTVSDGVNYQLVDNMLYPAKKVDRSTSHHLKGRVGA